MNPMAFYKQRYIVVLIKALTSLFFLLLFSLPSFTHRVHARGVFAVYTQIVTHGVKLSVSVPRRTYPENALVNVTVRLQNLTPHNVFMSGNNGFSVAVLDSGHHLVYSADSPFMDASFFAQMGMRRPPVTLRPHRTTARSIFVIMRGPFLQAQVILVARGKSKHQVMGTDLLPLTLTHEPAPTVVVSGSPLIHAAITPPPGVFTLPYVVEQTQCISNGISSTRRGWDAAPGNDLVPVFPLDCISGRKWMAYAGWVNHPIAEVDYSEAAHT